MRHLRVRWTSQGVEIAPLVNGKIPYTGIYSAKYGWSDIRLVECDPSEVAIKKVRGKKLTDIFEGKDIAGNKSLRNLGSGIQLGDYAINACLAGKIDNITGTPIGHIVIDGKLVNDTANSKWAAFIVWKDGSTSIGQFDRTKIHLMKYALSCSPQIGKAGKIFVNSHYENTPNDMMIRDDRARTAISIKFDGKIMGAVLDGDSDWDAGVRVDVLAAILIHFGARDILNLDGGGSSAMLKLEAVSKLILNKPIPYNVMHIPIVAQTRPGTKVEMSSITIHNTANPTSTAINERNWLINPSNTRIASWNIAVDDKMAVEAIPIDEIAYHAGNALGNRTSIGIEVCESGDQDKTWDNAVRLIASMLDERGWGVERVQTHRSWSGKNCPRLILPRWDEFINDIKSHMKQKPEVKDAMYRVIVDGKQVVAARMTENILMEVEKAIVQNANEIIVSKA